MYLQEVYEDKNDIALALINNTDIVTEIDSSFVSHASDLIGNNIYSYMYIPQSDAANDAKTYICFDFYVVNIHDRMLKNTELHFYIFSHQDIMKDDNGYSKVDVIQSLIDKMLNGTVKFGVDKMKLKSSLPLNVSNTYRGKELVYSVITQNQDGKKLDDWEN